MMHLVKLLAAISILYHITILANDLKKNALVQQTTKLWHKAVTPPVVIQHLQSRCNVDMATFYAKHGLQLYNVHQDTQKDDEKNAEKKERRKNDKKRPFLIYGGLFSFACCAYVGQYVKNYRQFILSEKKNRYASTVVAAGRFLVKMTKMMR